MSVRIMVGDCRDVLRTLPEESIHMAATSPAYYGLRDYKVAPSIWGGDPACEHDFACEAVTVDVDGGRRKGVNLAAWSAENARGGAKKAGTIEAPTARQGFCRHCGAWRGCLGLEPDWRLYLEHVVEVFREVRRVLRRDGTLWLNVGDSYASGTTTRGHSGSGTEAPRPRGFPPKGETSWAGYGKTGRAVRDGSHAGKHTAMTGRRRGSNRAQRGDGNDGEAYGPMVQPNRMPQPLLKPKDRMMMPARIAIALCDDGWWLRDEIIWHKPNPMPSSIEDRTTPAHEMVYLLTKRARYFYDAEAIKEAAIFGRRENPNNIPRSDRSAQSSGMWRNVGNAIDPVERGSDQTGATYDKDAGRNRRSVWTIATEPFPEAHFATFPTSLVEPMILAGTSARGCCTRCAAPWERVVAKIETGKLQKMADGWDTGAGGHGAFHREGRESGEAGVPVTVTSTLGWWPTCRCDALGDLPPHPRKPKNAMETVLEVWREKVAEVDAQRAGMCDAAKVIKTAPAVVLDPFGGSGTVALVAERMDHPRDSLLVELNPDYAAMARRRIDEDAPLFAAGEAAE